MPTPMEIAATMVGRGEVPDNASLREYLKNGGANLDPATTAWCAAFVNSSLGQAGIKGTGSNMAKSFLNFGEATDTPQKGDLAVFSRGDPKGPFGHVGFFDSLNPDGTVRVLGGNQGDSVSYANYPSNRLLGYRSAGKVGGDSNVARNFDPQVAGQTNTPLGPLFGSMNGYGGSSGGGIDPIAAQLAAGPKEKKQGNTWGNIGAAIDASIPSAPGISGGGGGFGNAGNILSTIMQNPQALAQALLKRRMV